MDTSLLVEILIRGVLFYFFKIRLNPGKWLRMAFDTSICSQTCTFCSQNSNVLKYIRIYTTKVTNVYEWRRIV